MWYHWFARWLWLLFRFFGRVQAVRGVERVNRCVLRATHVDSCSHLSVVDRCCILWRRGAVDDGLGGIQCLVDTASAWKGGLVPASEAANWLGICRPQIKLSGRSAIPSAAQRRIRGLRSANLWIRQFYDPPSPRAWRTRDWTSFFKPKFLINTLKVETQ